MVKLVCKTTRVERGWLDRLKGVDRLYRCKLTDGERTVYGKGQTRQSAEKNALRKWHAAFGEAPE
jgi:hypothetical protein